MSTFRITHLDPRDPPMPTRDDRKPDPELLSTRGIPAYVQALEACLSGEDRIADRCSACDLPRAWHFDKSQILLLGCDFAQRVRLRPELRAMGSASVLPLDHEPTVSRAVFEALRSGRCPEVLNVLCSSLSMDELLVVARELTNTVISAQAEVDDAR